MSEGTKLAVLCALSLGVVVVDTVRGDEVSIVVTLPDGTSERLHERGEDPDKWYTDDEGFAVLHLKGGLRYALRDERRGAWIATVIEVGSVSPYDCGLKPLPSKVIQESPAVDAALIDDRAGRLTPHGDASDRWYTDALGFPIVVVPERFVYAIRDAEGKLVSTGLILGESDPARAGLRPLGSMQASGTDIVIEGSNGYVSLLAEVNLTRGKGRIHSIDQAVRPLRDMSGDLDPRFSVCLYGPNRKLIVRHRLRYGRNTDRRPGEDQTGLVQGVFPSVRGVQRVSLMIDEREVDQRRIPADRPRVILLQTTESQDLATLDCERAMQIRWESKPKDGLSFSVQMSPDEGKTWETIAVGLRESVLDISANDLERYPSVQFRVVANNGFYSAAKTSEVIRLTD